MPGRFLLQHTRGEQQEIQGVSDPPATHPPRSSESYQKWRCCFKPSLRIIIARSRFIYFNKFNVFLMCGWGLRITGLANYLGLFSPTSHLFLFLLPGSVSPSSSSGRPPSHLRPRAALFGSEGATFEHGLHNFHLRSPKMSLKNHTSLTFAR